MLVVYVNKLLVYGMLESWGLGCWSLRDHAAQERGLCGEKLPLGAADGALRGNALRDAAAASVLELRVKRLALGLEQDPGLGKQGHEPWYVVAG